MFSLRAVSTVIVIAVSLLLVQVVQSRPTGEDDVLKQFKEAFEEIAPIANETFANSFYETRLDRITKLFNDTIHDAATVFKTVVRDAENLVHQNEALKGHIEGIKHFNKQVAQVKSKTDVFEAFEDFSTLSDKYQDEDTREDTPEVKAIEKLMDENGYGPLMINFVLRIMTEVLSFFAEISMYIATLDDAQRKNEHKLLQWWEETTSDDDSSEIKEKRLKVFPEMIQKTVSRR